MADDPIYGNKDVFEQGGAGVVATLALAAQQLNVPLEVQGAIAMVGSFIGLGLGRSVYRAATRRYPKFARGFLNAFDPDPVKAALKAKSSAEKLSENLDDVMMRSFRLMMDAVTDEVVPVLGYMAGLYTFERKRPDAFFRGLGRLLCELEPGELDQLRKVIKLAMLPGKYPGGAIVHLAYEGAVQSFRETLETVHGVPSAVRLFALLKQEGFGTQYVPEADDDSSHAPEECIFLAEPMLGKGCRILMP